jgi:hypothetical protein
VSVTYVLAEADRVFRQCRREFAGAFAARLGALGARAATLSRGTQLLWSCGGGHGFATLRPLDRPAANDLCRPLVPAASLGAPPAGTPQAAYRAVGLGQGRPPGPGPRHVPAATFAALPDEVAALAPWLAEWAVSRLPPRRRLRPPPVPLRGPVAGRRARAARTVWTVRAYEAHWRWRGPALLREVAARKGRLELAFDDGAELSLLQAETEAERRRERLIYADWLEEGGHDFEGLCLRLGIDPADVLVGGTTAWGLRRGPFATRPGFYPGRLRFPLLAPGANPAAGRCYRSAAEAKAAFLSAWEVAATAGG